MKNFKTNSQYICTCSICNNIFTSDNKRSVYCGCKVDNRLGSAYYANGGKWPESLVSGIMFYDGLRITREEFEQYER